MFKKIVVVLCVGALVITLTACRNSENTEEPIDTDEYSEDLGPTPEELRAEFELFFIENKERIIESVATEGEDVRLELAAGYEFVMTILLDDIALEEENRTLYTLTFELSFAQMADFFEGLAKEIKETAEIDRFRLSVVFVDINEEEIARSSFDADSLSDEEIEADEHEETDE